MDLKKGDTILIFENNGKYFFQNSASATVRAFQESMKGEAENAGFNDPDDVVKYIKSRRKERNKYIEKYIK
jgi:hypothetical protein